jgi:hypothetical protein
MRSGKADLGGARHGKAQHGMVRYGYSCRRQHWSPRAPLLLSSGSGQGTVGKAKAGLGVDWHGKVKAADGSTEHFGVPCCSLWRVDLAGLGRIRSGMAVSGGVWR